MLLAAASAVVAGCGGGTLPPKPPDRRPTEIETRDAYFNTPLILDGQVEGVELGITRATLFAHFGVATISYRPARSPRDLCVIYPISGTQVWDARGSPEAAEWEFCFNPGGRLVTKRRLAPGSPRSRAAQRP